MIINNVQATRRIRDLMREIRDTIWNMEPQPEDRYLSLTIHDDGTISFNNTYWVLPEDQRIHYYEGLEDEE